MIYTKQIDSPSLTAFIVNAMSGAALSGSLAPYFQSSGWVGDGVVYRTGAQSITGVKTFLDSPRVPYSGNTGTAPSTLFVLDQIAALNASSSALYLSRGTTPDIVSGLKVFTGAVQVGNPTSTGHAVNLFTLTGATGSLLSLRVTGSAPIQIASMSGLGGTVILWSGNNIFISGAAGGGGGSSNTSVTGSSAISAPNFTGVGLATLTYDGTYVRVSGATDLTTSGYFENNFVHRGLFNDNISGLKTFTGAVGVGVPTNSGHAVNQGYLTGVSGALISQLAPGNTINTGTFFTFTGITGNFVNMSFYFDEFNLYTGLNVIESLVSRDFFFTGYAIGVINTGTQGFFSGSFYQRNTTNVKTNFINFGHNSGQFFTAAGGFNQIISGMNRVGLDIYRIGTGITGLSVGLFGVGY